jgi:hypothetical protein
MVTVGFIVEGDSEVILIKSEPFINFLNKIQLHCSNELVINAGGKFNLYHPKGDFSKIEIRVNGWIETLKDKGAELIFILLDFDDSDDNYTSFKQKIFHQENNIIVVAKQELEAWYLADTNALNKYLGTTGLEIENPESFLKPLEELKRLRNLYSNKGIADKKFLTKHFISSGFSLQNAANHQNCFSAKYFLSKLMAAAIIN